MLDVGGRTVGIGPFVAAALADLRTFLDSAIAHAPTLRAALLLAIILGVLAGLAHLLSILVERFLMPKSAPLELDIVPENGEGRVVRLTRTRLQRFGFREGERVVVIVNGEYGQRSVVAEVQVRRATTGFGDDAAALSLDALRGLGNSEVEARDGSKVSLRHLNWYSPQGILYRTVFDPNLSVSLTWIVTVVSIAVSIGVSEFYYQRGLDREAAGALRPTIHEASSAVR